MRIDAKKTQCMQLASFLIKNHSYQFVSVQQSEDEIWLGNKSHSEFPIIRITSASSDELFFDKNRVLMVHSAISQFFQRESALLQICISEETAIETDEEILISVISKDQILGFDLNSAFPGIQKALAPFDNPQLEYAMLLKEIELSQRTKAQQKRKLFSMKWPVATVSVIALCVCIYLAVQFVSLTYEDLVACSIALGAYYKAFVVLNHDFWRLLTCGFVHSDLTHLVMNMLALYNMGRFCEEVFGWKKYLLILITSIVSGSMLMHLTSLNIVGLGISGGIYGLMGAFMVYAFSKGYFRQKSFQHQISNIIFINLMMNFIPGVAYTAHLGGLACGVLFGIIFCDFGVKDLKHHAIVCLLVLLMFASLKTVQQKKVDPVYPGTDMLTAEIYQSFGLDGYAENLRTNTMKYYLEIQGE